MNKIRIRKKTPFKLGLFVRFNLQIRRKRDYYLMWSEGKNQFNLNFQTNATKTWNENYLTSSMERERVCVSKKKPQKAIVFILQFMVHLSKNEDRENFLFKKIKR